MEAYLKLFDTHADETFARFLSQGLTRPQALAATEAYFMSLKKPFNVRRFWSTGRLMKFSS